MRKSDAVTLDGDEQPAVFQKFASQLSTSLVGRRVRVESIGGHRFEGKLVSVHVEARHVLLRDVEDIPGGARTPNAFVAGVDWIVPVDDESERTGERA